MHVAMYGEPICKSASQARPESRTREVPESPLHHAAASTSMHTTSPLPIGTSTLTSWSYITASAVARMRAASTALALHWKVSRKAPLRTTNPHCSSVISTICLLQRGKEVPGPAHDLLIVAVCSLAERHPMPAHDRATGVRSGWGTDVTGSFRRLPESA